MLYNWLTEIDRCEIESLRNITWGKMKVINNIGRTGRGGVTKLLFKRKSSWRRAGIGVEKDLVPSVERLYQNWREKLEERKENRNDLFSRRTAQVTSLRKLLYRHQSTDLICLNFKRARRFIATSLLIVALSHKISERHAYIAQWSKTVKYIHKKRDKIRSSHQHRKPQIKDYIKDYN